MLITTLMPAALAGLRRDQSVSAAPRAENRPAFQPGLRAGLRPPEAAEVSVFLAVLGSCHSVLAAETAAGAHCTTDQRHGERGFPLTALSSKILKAAFR